MENLERGTKRKKGGDLSGSGSEPHPGSTFTGTHGSFEATTAPPRRPLRPWQRRLGLVVAAVSVIAAVAVGTALKLYGDALRSNVGDLSFRNRLRIPALAEARADPSGRLVFDLAVGAGTSRLSGEGETAVLAVNGTYLGPTVRARQGDAVTVNVTNGLGEVTTMHWHGMHLPASADGGPHQPIQPGSTWSPAWTVDQPPATLWYHAHPEGRTGEQVYRGVAGLFLVDPAGEVPLPSRYGVDDVPLIIQDRTFADDGQFDLSSTRFSPIGLLGDRLLVNGTPDPYFEATTGLVRFRVLNASNARTYDLGFSDGRGFWTVASDAGFLPAPQPVERLRVAPSERAEIVVKVDPGDAVVLRSFPTRLGAGNLPPRFAGGDDSFDVLRLVAGEQLAVSPSLPGRLPGANPVAIAPGTPVRVFSFNHASRINGRSYDPTRADFTVHPGSAEVWELRNRSDNQHVFHVHGVSFTILEQDGRRPPPERAGLKDSVLLPRGTTTRLAVRFERWVDPMSPYMFHCHLLAHEDHGMMGQYLVVA